MNTTEARRRLNFAFEKILKKRKIRRCLLSGVSCSGAAIDSHSIQNAAILEKLSEDGHVYTLRSSMDYLGPKLKYTGRNTASTFSGFCSFHDTKLFRDIDFTTGSIPSVFTSKQMVLFFLRAISIEGWKKQNIINSYADLAPALRKGDFARAAMILEAPEQMIREIIKNPEVLEMSFRGHLMGLDDMKRLMGSLLWQIDQQKFHGTISHHWVLNSESDVALTSGLSPLWDTRGNDLYGSFNQTSKDKMCHCGLTVFEANGKTHIFVSYLKKDQGILGPLFTQIDKIASVESEMKKWMTEFILENCENVVFRPSFIDALSPAQKSDLEKAAGWILTSDGAPGKNFSFCFFR